MIESQKIIGVIGGSQCTPEDYVDAEVVGRLIAQNDAILICGGLSGIMEAACKGAYETGGETIGILPGESILDANPYVKTPIATGMGIARNIIIVRTAQVLIAVDGRYGTLSEIAYALQLGRPVFCLNSWNDIQGVTPVKSAQEAVEKAIEYLGESI